MTTLFKGRQSISVTCLLLLLITTTGFAAASGSFVLITDEEYRESLEFDQSAVERMQPKGAIGAPEIELRSPVLESTSITSPVDIEVHFTAQGDAQIDMDTLRIFYVLLFKKDITKRLLEHAETGDAFVKASGAELPAGKHSFILEIKDTMSRTARSQFDIVVTGT